MVQATTSGFCPTPGPNGNNTNLDPMTFVILLSQFLAIAMVGVVAGILLMGILWIPFVRFRLCGSFRIYRSYLKGALILPLGFLIFRSLRAFSQASLAAWGREISVEPLMVCMIAASVAGHTSGNREQFDNILEKTAPYIFLPFFTLTGASLQLDQVVGALPSALAVVALRMTSIFVGLYVEEMVSSSSSSSSSCCLGRKNTAMQYQEQQQQEELEGEQEEERRRNERAAHHQSGLGGGLPQYSPMSEASTRAPMQSPGRISLGESLLEHEQRMESLVGGCSRQREEDEENREQDRQQQDRQEEQEQEETRRLVGREEKKSKWFWMGCTMMSQAGVALGLAFEIQGRFQKWGNQFSTLILSVVVLNQMLGPPLCKVGFVMLGGGSSGNDGSNGSIDSREDNKIDEEEEARFDEFAYHHRGVANHPAASTTTTTVEVLTSIRSSPHLTHLANNHSSMISMEEEDDVDDDLLLRALSHPDTLVRVMQSSSEKMSLAAAAAASHSMVVNAQQQQQQHRSSAHTASAYSLLGGGSPRARSGSASSSSSHRIGRKSNSASIDSSNIITGRRSTTSESEDVVMQMRSPSSLLMLSRSPSRGLARDMSALRARRDASLKVPSVGENGGARKNM